MAADGSGVITTDRHGVPQYGGDVDSFEECEERSWDLFYGREGQDSLQIVTPIHLWPTTPSVV